MHVKLLCVSVLLWTALSLALGLEIHGEIIRGLPCIKRLNQLFCPTAGNTYPKNKIERFIDDNKALVRRMYGEFLMQADYPGRYRGKRYAEEFFMEDTFPSNTDSRTRRSSDHSKNNTTSTDNTSEDAKSRMKRARQQPKLNTQSKSSRVDICESSVEIVTPYWASNSAGKIRAIVNTEHFEQAIQQEVCQQSHTRRCQGDCGCEQKYKWHRLLAYEPDDDCKGIFMDWFLFPSCCVCRCDPLGSN